MNQKLHTTRMSQKPRNCYELYLLDVEYSLCNVARHAIVPVGQQIQPFEALQCDSMF